MGGYLPNTDAQRKEMMEAIGVKSFQDFYSVVPKNLMLANGNNVPEGKSELEIERDLTAISQKNKVFSTVFRGAGAYRHFIPSVVKTIVNKETFLTAYTPYQPEISQGLLQNIFEYQTMICELTGMDASNASVYDGATGAAEAIAMCVDNKRPKALVSAAAQPDVIETVKTYCWATGTELELIPVKDGKTDQSALSAMLNEKVACVYLQQPNFFGIIEDAEEVGAMAHGAGAKFIMAVNPTAMAILKSPGECGADIAVGEGQPLGLSLNFGGPYIGFMAATSAMIRKLPGRIVGETTDPDGKRAFVLTLQAREQHIRRDKASSNICSNQALCAMTTAVYMATLGPKGLADVATQSMAKAHYLAQELAKVGFERKHTGEFFHEFLTTAPADADQIMSVLEANGILGGLPVEGGILWCATEMNTKQEIDAMIQLIQSARSKGGKA